MGKKKTKMNWKKKIYTRMKGKKLCWMSCCKLRDPEAVCEVRERRMIHKQVNFSAHVFSTRFSSFYGFMNVTWMPRPFSARPQSSFGALHRMSNEFLWVRLDNADGYIDRESNLEVMLIVNGKEVWRFRMKVIWTVKMSLFDELLKTRIGSATEFTNFSHKRFTGLMRGCFLNLNRM